MRPFRLSLLRLLPVQRITVISQRSARMHQDALVGLENWSASPSTIEATSLARTFRFKYFKHAWAFMSRVADECQRQKHHPEWSNTYNIVYVKWTTHSTGGLTDKDLIMARLCDDIARDVGEIAQSKDDQVQQKTEPKSGDTLQELADNSAIEGCIACAKRTS